MKRFMVPRVAHCDEGCRIGGREFISFPLFYVKISETKI